MPKAATPAVPAKIGTVQYQTLFAGVLGWMLDGMDAMLFSFALLPIRDEFHLTNTQAGVLASLPLLTALVGVGFGWLADRVGRVRALSASILTYSIFTALCATSRSFAELALWRALVGVGLGGEWAAGAALVAETWPDEHRAKAIGIMQSGWAVGYLLAAGLAATVLPRFGWRMLFLAGAGPAIVTVWLRLRLRHLEPERRPSAEASTPWRVLFSHRYLRTTVTATALTTLVLFAYWGLFTWIPTYLSSPLEVGGAGLGVVKSSSWMIPMQLGSLVGYASFGFLADRFGRRPVFVGYVLAAAVAVLAYGTAALHPELLFILGPLVGCFGHGYFSVFGTLLAELFPGEARATAQAFCYNTGKALSAAAPVVIGALASQTGVGGALAVTSGFFALSALVMMQLPETRGRSL